MPAKRLPMKGSVEPGAAWKPSLVRSARGPSADFHFDGYISRSEGPYRTLIRGQTLTSKGSPCWCSRGSPLGEGSPCDSSIVERNDNSRALCRGQGWWKIRAR